jgi:E3 ubiquitin-protein ligase TRIP12
MTSPVGVVLEALESHFLDPGAGAHEDMTLINCVVARDNLWEDGLVVLNRLGSLRNALSVRFVGENGTGIGPTREFFSLMSVEFRSRRDLWRRDPLLFPRPGANPHLIYLLGVFCAKAIALGFRVDLPMHPVFFEIVGGDIGEKTCEKIDRQFARSLEDLTALFDLCFLFPDEDCEELVPGGMEIIVDEDNVQDYVKILKERMMCIDLAAIFKRGFETVIPWESTKVFSLEELLVVLNGVLVKPFTITELEEHVVPDQGYDRGSLQIQWLYEVMLEFNDDERIAFVQFVTGSRTLPIGGLGGLRPELHVAKKIGEVDGLPTVSTCQTYLKIPEYRTKEELKEKLTRAILDGREGFDLA